MNKREEHQENPINRSALSAMTHRIDLYKQHKLDLPQLASSLSSIAGGMINPPADWRNSFMQYWGVIEQANALALDSGKVEPLAEHRAILDKAIEDLQAFLEQGI
ncbi:MAG: hypothetical protein F6K00_02390 [Leptolyngbya sp. SIOISBB]|nr:hypothetical protein [Leptolyngbya sp. SIOISBB]